MLQTTMRFVSTVLTIYSLIILVRIVLTWMPGASFGRVGQFLAKVTDPYLNLFRRVRFLTIGSMDFSPVMGLILLSIANRIAATLAFSQAVHWTTIVAVVVQVVAGAIGFFSGLLAIVGAVRLIGLLAKRDVAQRFWYLLDHLLQPIAYRIANAIMRGRPIKYLNTLILFIAVMLVVTIGVNVLGSLLISLLLQAQT